MLNEMGGPNVGPFLCAGLVTRNTNTNELSYSGQHKAFEHIAKYINKSSKIYPISVGEEYDLQIKNYIDANYMYNIKISDIAKDVNLDRKYLARIYKLKTGYTMKKHIIKNEWKRQRIFWVMDIMLTKLLS